MLIIARLTRLMQKSLTHVTNEPVQFVSTSEIQPIVDFKIIVNISTEMDANKLKMINRSIKTFNSVSIYLAYYVL